MPYEELVICGHCMILQKIQALFTRKVVDILEITDPAQRVARLQILVELRVARARVMATITEGSIHTKHSRCVQDSTDAAEQILHRGPLHDVEGVGREDGIEAAYR